MVRRARAILHVATIYIRVLTGIRFPISLSLFLDYIELGGNKWPQHEQVIFRIFHINRIDHNFRQWVWAAYR